MNPLFSYLLKPEINIYQTDTGTVLVLQGSLVFSFINNDYRS